jgi:hypothetical protein
MSDLGKDVDRFMRLVRETPDLWRSVDVRTLAADIDGKQVNLLCTAALNEKAPADLPEESIDAMSSPIAAHRKVLDFADLDSLFDELKSGAIRFGKKTVDFTHAGSTGKAGSAYSSGYTRRATTMPRAVRPGGFPIGHYLIARGDMSQAVFSQVEDGLDGLNDSLRRMPRPWDGVDSIARHFLQTNSRIAFQGTVNFEAFAPIRARFGASKCGLTEGELSLCIVSDPDVAPHLRVGYFGIGHDDRIGRGNVPVTKEAWKSSGSHLVCSVAAPLPNAASASLFLSVGDSNIDRVEVGSPGYRAENHRAVAYAMTDPQLAVLRKALTQKPGTREKHFEKGVTRLFYLGGLLSDSYAFEEDLTNGPDAHAFTPDGTSALLIECTVGPIAKKLSQLVTRAAQLNRTLGADAPQTIVPLVATALQRSDLSENDLNAASADGIAVLAQEDLLDLLNVVGKRVSPAEVIAYCKTKIPRRTDVTRTNLFTQP